MELIIISFLAIVCISAWFLVKDAFTFSLNQMFWLFHLLFLGIVPLFQYLFHSMPVGNTIKEEDSLQANLVILAGIVSYLIIKKLTILKEVDTGNNKETPIVYLSIKSSILLLIFLVTPILIVKTVAPKFLNLSTLLLTTHLLYGALLALVLLTIRNYTASKKTYSVQLLILLFCSFFLLFKTPERYIIAAFLLGIILSLPLKILKGKFNFRIFMLAAILFVYPILSLLKYPKQEIITKISNPSKLFKSLYTYNFDVYATLCRSLTYVQMQGTTYGRQIEGALLFWVPRSYWHNKPIGSGALVYRSLNLEFTNYASPLTAEGFINFGLSGVIMFYAFIAFFVKKYDFWYHQKQRVNNYVFLFYPAALALFFYFLRGDMMSSIAYSSGLYISSVLFFSLIKKAGPKNGPRL